MATTFVVPDTAVHAVELLRSNLLYINHSSSVPRDPNRWHLWCDGGDYGGLVGEIHTAYATGGEPKHCWHYNDFAYAVED